MRLRGVDTIDHIVGIGNRRIDDCLSVSVSGADI
jgi:hypothetical protein